jgi:hypothetical protein
LIWLSALSACGGSGSKVVPSVGQRLDLARHIKDAGLGFEDVGGGTFGVVVRFKKFLPSS